MLLLIVSTWWRLLKNLGINTSSNLHPIEQARNYRCRRLRQQNPITLIQLPRLDWSGKKFHNFLWTVWLRASALKLRMNEKIESSANPLAHKMKMLKKVTITTLAKKWMRNFGYHFCSLFKLFFKLCLNFFGMNLTLQYDTVVETFLYTCWNQTYKTAASYDHCMKKKVKIDLLFET